MQVLSTRGLSREGTSSLAWFTLSQTGWSYTDGHVDWDGLTGGEGHKGGENKAELHLALWSLSLCWRRKKVTRRQLRALYATVIL